MVHKQPGGHTRKRQNMDIYKIFLILVLFCLVNQGLAWWGGGRDRSPSRATSRSISSSSSSRSSSSSGSRNRVSEPSGTNRKAPPFPKRKPKPPPKSADRQNTHPETDMKKVIEGYEALRLKAYDAQPKNKKVHDTTIGIGFSLNRHDAEKTFKKVVPGVDFNKVKSGEETITKDQARALFNHDIDNIYEPRARTKIGKDVYDKLPSNVKTAVVNAVYRGDLGARTTELIKQGKWKEVGKEYLNHDQYREADKLGIPGVRSRMDWNKKQFDTMIKN